eukprot:jgi/Psemu1/322487/estExt_fgenesh1_pg.C_300033
MASSVADSGSGSTPNAGSNSNMSNSSSSSNAGSVSPSSKSLDTLADEFLLANPSPSARVKLFPDPLPKGEVGVVRLRTLVERRAWGNVLKLASRFLGNGSGTFAKKSGDSSTSMARAEQYQSLYASLLTPSCDDLPMEVKRETAEIMVLQCHALLKLRMYPDLSREVKRWKFLKQNDVNAEPIEWIPWAIHILAAQSLEYSTETAEQTTDVLCHLREDIPADESGWLASLDSALANTYLWRSEWRLAIGALDRVLDLLPEAAKAECGGNGNEELAAFLSNTYSAEILSRQGRIFLQVGGLSEASERFERAKTMWTESESISKSISMSVLPPDDECKGRIATLSWIMRAGMELDTGLLRFSESDYDAALQAFTSASTILLSDKASLSPSSGYRTRDWVGPAAAGSQEPSVLYSDAINNVSLCHLYSCRIAESVAALEGLVREDPTAFLTERTAANLGILYDLQLDSVVTTRNKRVLQKIAHRFFLHELWSESFGLK